MTRMTVGAAIRWLADEDPDRPAVRDDDRALTRAELVEEAERYATVLLRHGVVQNDLVSVRLGNTVEFVVACVAIWLVGATPQPLSPRLAAEEQNELVELADSRVIIGGHPREFVRSVIPSGIVTVHEPRHHGDSAAARWKAPASSGSTGRPKIVLAEASAHIDPEALVAEFIPRAAVQLVAAPLSHSAPFTYAMRGLMTGHSLVLLPRFDAQRVLDEIGRHRVSWMMLVPTMMHRMLRLPNDRRLAADLSSLESILHIGAPCAPTTKRAFIDWFGAERVVEVYAGSESNGLTMIRGDEWLRHPGSVGRPIGGSTMRVVDGDGHPLPTGEHGLVEMRRPGAQTYRYLGATESVRDGWHSLGDIGYLDDSGYLYIVDRADDLVITGGTNVYPIEVEQALERHPSVRSAAVVGVADEELGQRLHAVADVAGASIRSADLLEWLRIRLDREKLPRTLDVVHQPVRDDAGKVRRRALVPVAED